MFKTLMFFVKIAALVAASVWLVSQPGVMNFDFMGYDVKIKTGVFLLSLAAFILVTLYLLRLVRAVFSVPNKVKGYREDQYSKKGYQALTKGLVAVAAGDMAKATQYSKETNKFLKGKSDLSQSGLPLLLEAQAARLRGEETLACHHFEKLSHDKDMAFIGLRGLMKSALQEQDYEAALGHALAAYQKNPNQAWIVKMLYALHLKNRQWESALKIAKKAEKMGAISPQHLHSDRISIHLMRHDYDIEQGDENHAFKELKSAYKLDAHFVPTIIRLSNHYLEANKKKKVASLIEETWKKNPHPDLADIWDDLSPREGKDSDKKRLAWLDKLVGFKDNCAEAYIAAAKATIDMGYWGEAKAYLMAAEKIYPTMQGLQLRAIVEQNMTHNDNGLDVVLEHAGNANPDKAWTCQQTGIVYNEWSAIAMPHDSFNTIIWDVPQARAMNEDILSRFESENSELLISSGA